MDDRASPSFPFRHDGYRGAPSPDLDGYGGAPSRPLDGYEGETEPLAVAPADLVAAEGRRRIP